LRERFFRYQFRTKKSAALGLYKITFGLSDLLDKHYRTLFENTIIILPFQSFNAKQLNELQTSNVCSLCHLQNLVKSPEVRRPKAGIQAPSLPVPEVTSTCQDSIHLQVLYCVHRVQSVCVHCTVHCVLSPPTVPEVTSACLDPIQLQVLYCTLCTVRLRTLCIVYSTVPSYCTCQDSIHLQVLYCIYMPGLNPPPDTILYTVYSTVLYSLQSTCTKEHLYLPELNPPPGTILYIVQCTMSLCTVLSTCT
jgi:hypothetical protein